MTSQTVKMVHERDTKRKVLYAAVLEPPAMGAVADNIYINQQFLPAHKPSTITVVVSWEEEGEEG